MLRGDDTPQRQIRTSRTRQRPDRTCLLNMDAIITKLHAQWDPNDYDWDAITLTIAQFRQIITTTNMNLDNVERFARYWCYAHKENKDTPLRLLQLSRLSVHK